MMVTQLDIRAGVRVGPGRLYNTGKARTNGFINI